MADDDGPAWREVSIMYQPYEGEDVESLELRAMDALADIFCPHPDGDSTGEECPRQFVSGAHPAKWSEDA